MPGQRSPNVVQVNLRLTKELRQRLHREAKAAGRSFNAEVVERIEQTFLRHTADVVLELAQKRLMAAQALHKLVAEKAAEVLASDTMKFRAGPPGKVRRVKK